MDAVIKNLIIHSVHQGLYLNAKNCSNGQENNPHLTKAENLLPFSQEQ